MLSYFGRKTVNSVRSQNICNLSAKLFKMVKNTSRLAGNADSLEQPSVGNERRGREWSRKQYESRYLIEERTQLQVNENADNIKYNILSQPTSFNQSMTTRALGELRLLGELRVLDELRVQGEGESEGESRRGDPFAKFGEIEGMKFKFNIDSIVQLLGARDSICGDSDKNKTNFILKKLNSRRNLFAKRERINSESFQCNFKFSTIASTLKQASSDSPFKTEDSSQSSHPSITSSINQITADTQAAAQSAAATQKHQQKATYLDSISQGSLDFPNKAENKPKSYSKEDYLIGKSSNQTSNNILSTFEKSLPFHSHNKEGLTLNSDMSKEPVMLMPQVSQTESANQINMIKNLENMSSPLESQENSNNTARGSAFSPIIGSGVDSDQVLEKEQQDQFQEVKQIVNQINQLEIVQSISKTTATNPSEKAQLPSNTNNQLIEEEDQSIHKQQSIASTSSHTYLTQKDSNSTIFDNHLPLSSSSQKTAESPLLTSNESSEQQQTSGRMVSSCRSPHKKYDTASDGHHSGSDKNSPSKRMILKNGQPSRNKQRSNTYKIEKKIGDGCSSVVYLAKELDESNNPLSNNLIAIKKFKKRKEQHFENEQKILNIVSGDHPNIMKIQSVNVPQMEIQSDYYPHGDLLEFVIKRGTLKESQARFFFKGIMKAVDFIQSHNICHRDLKLENVLLDSEYNPILIDFAFASLNKSNFTEFLGTDGYQAPEILQKQPYCGHTSDNFSLGVMLFEMIMGKPPFQSAKLDQGLYKKFTQTNEEYWEVFKKYNAPSEEVKDLINKLLEEDPTKRISVQEILSHSWMAESNPVEQIQL